MNHPLRELAYQWHSGQWSPLYAFASSGIVTDREELLLEINDCLRDANKFDRLGLVAMQDLVHALPQRPNGHYHAPWAKEESE